MTPKVLVVSTVHHADDTRIRERLVTSLAEVFEVTYATRTPRPSDTSDHTWLALKGGRVARILRATRLLATTDANVVSMHDPELIVCGWVARMRGIRVVFDLHERFPDQLAEKNWMPRWLAGTARFVAKGSLGFGSFVYDITLAEKGYADLFSQPHPVFENYPKMDEWPTRGVGDGTVIYVGDVTRERGIDVAVGAAGLAAMPLVVIGSYEATFGTELEVLAQESGTALDLTGRLPNHEALRRVARASVAISPLRSSRDYNQSLPTKILEYASVGIPIVASALPGTREAVDGLSGVRLVEPGSVEALAQGLVEASHAQVQEAALADIEATRARFVWPTEAVKRFYLGLVT